MSVFPMLVSVDPATGEPVGEVPRTPVEAIPGLVARARAAQVAWAGLGLEGRVSRLRPVGARLLAEADALGRLITREMGKPLREGIGEAKDCGGGWSAELDEMAHALAPEVLEDAATRTTMFHDPLGVCAAITPWNFPLEMPHWMILPALVAGNAVVFKPSEETPLIGARYAELLNEVLPPDVLIVVQGDEAQGRALVAADVDLIAFTGSRAAGRQILATAAHDLKRVILELGGKDPMIVLDDANVGLAARFAARNSFRNCGQVCVSTERIYVDRKIAEAFLTALAGETAKMTVGHGLLARTFVGPMVAPWQRDHVLAQIDAAVAAGARIVAGGAGHHGNFVVPTVLTDVTHAMDVAREETFGPVAVVIPVDGDDEAVRLANDTPYGLGAVVFGEDEARATAVARRLTAGMIGVNRGVGGAAGSPWVGARHSGYGYHKGVAGHRQFTQVRILSTPARRPPAP
ncbi:aldehyde dehydrogenase family protein [Myxococcota bacterium]|nr:aldehyde dehydrogenase family protein [Myxococcota bacterium]